MGLLGYLAPLPGSADTSHNKTQGTTTAGLISSSSFRPRHFFLQILFARAPANSLIHTNAVPIVSSKEAPQRKRESEILTVDPHARHLATAHQPPVAMSMKSSPVLLVVPWVWASVTSLELLPAASNAMNAPLVARAIEPPLLSAEVTPPVPTAISTCPLAVEIATAGS